MFGAVPNGRAPGLTLTGALVRLTQIGGVGVQRCGKGPASQGAAPLEAALVDAAFGSWGVWVGLILVGLIVFEVFVLYVRVGGD